MKAKLGKRSVGDGEPCYVIAELGINHNGSLDMAKRLIDAAANAGAAAVKLQKRTVEVVYGRAPHTTTERPTFLDEHRDVEELRRWHPQVKSTQRGQKLALELDRSAWEMLAMHARAQGLDFTASCWDERALADVLAWVDPPWLKVASPCTKDRPLLRAHCETGLPLVVSTGGLTTREVEDLHADLLGWGAKSLAYLHCCSIYPAPPQSLNLRAIETMRRRLPSIPIGYSGHETGLETTVAAVVLGACVVERHLTLDRAEYGSDQAASVEPHGFARLVRDIRAVEAALGDGVKRAQPGEAEVMAKLRRTA